jgi:hypothetical protein
MIHTQSVSNRDASLETILMICPVDMLERAAGDKRSDLRYRAVIIMERTLRPIVADGKSKMSPEIKMCVE